MKPTYQADSAAGYESRRPDPWPLNRNRLSQEIGRASIFLSNCSNGRKYAKLKNKKQTKIKEESKERKRSLTGMKKILDTMQKK